MRITSVTIKNFRGLKHVELDLGPTTVLIGENNSGKTSVLDALRLCLRELGPRRRVVFDSLDFHLKDGTTEPQSAEPIEIEIWFSENAPGEWSKSLVGGLTRQKVLQVDGDGRNHVGFRVTCAYNPTNRDFTQDWAFLNLDGKPLGMAPESARERLQREVALFYLSALRDAGRHFDAKGPFWRPFLKDSQLTEEKKVEIEEKLRQINELVVGSHASFEQALVQLGKVQEVVPMAGGDVVSIEAVPGRMFDILARAQVHLGAPTGAKIPIARHGEGTQSLAVLMLFSAFLNTRAGGSSVVALEEPEAHLHPSAVRALWDILDLIDAQKVISTHSGDLLSEVDVLNVRRLARADGEIRAYRVAPGLLTEEETRKFNYHIRRSRGELLFARCWLLVEGETESWIYPAAARALGINLHRDGVRVVEYSQSDIGLLAKVANVLGIQWYCVVDNDSGKNQYEPKVKDNLGGAAEEDRLCLPYRNMETHLLEKGFHEIYYRHMPDQKRAKLSKARGDDGYWAEFAHHLPGKAKTRAAAEVALEMESRGSDGVTAEIRGILEKVVGMAGGA